MKETKFTRGEWSIYGGYEIRAKGCEIEIAKVTVFNQGKANAKLIKTAPKLYETLEFLLENVDMSDQH